MQPAFFCPPGIISTRCDTKLCPGNKCVSVQHGTIMQLALAASAIIMSNKKCLRYHGHRGSMPCVC
eukprot:2436498-Pleurochrysis_carterae.AAC.1